ncbi:hypothetical protein BH11PAT3_BH11PAT3_1700 [soil metagenome]
MLKKVFHSIVYIFALIGFVLVVGYFGVRYGLTNTKGAVDLQREWFLKNANAKLDAEPLWATTEEWKILETAIRRDLPLINRAATEAGVSPRLIVSNLLTEQLRLFFTEREFYKQFFFPLKILGSQTQFSWGVMGIKEATAIEIENHLKDRTSPFYLGPEHEHALDFNQSDMENIKKARFTRMTDQHDHYWSYLYAGLYLKQIETQWQNAGMTIGDKPEILATLYNIGFDHSKPNSSPSMGGAEITMNNKTYTFGGLAGEFYYSNLLADIFPR